MLNPTLSNDTPELLTTDPPVLVNVEIVKNVFQVFLVIHVRTLQTTR